MYLYNKPTETTIALNQSYEGETIEQKVDRIVNNAEPISDGAPLIYTERKDGVMPEYDIRTDRWELAVDAMTHVSKTELAKREARIVEMNKKEVGDQPIQATGAKASDNQTPS